MKHDFLYSVEREYDVPIEQLWQAWVDPAALEKWYSPTDLSVVSGSVINDVTVGGRWAIGVDVSAHGFNAYFWGSYSEVVPHKKLVHSMAYSQDANEFARMDDNAPMHNVVIEFESRGTADDAKKSRKSWVKFSQYGELPEGHAPQAQAGMESYFDNLERYLAGT